MKIINPIKKVKRHTFLLTEKHEKQNFVKKVIKVAFQLIPLFIYIYFYYTIPDSIQGQLLIACIWLFLCIRLFVIKSNAEKLGEITNMPVTTISNLTEGYIKIKGKIQAIDYLTSIYKKKHCIGYRYKKEKRIVSKKSLKKEKKHLSQHISFKTLDSKKEIKDFYFYDNTGKVLVNSAQINFFNGANVIREKENDILYTENLLLDNDDVYYLIGYYDSFSKLIRKGKNKNITHEFFLVDKNNSSFFNKTPVYLSIGSRLFIIAFTSLFAIPMSIEFWTYFLKLIL